jgi:hypothetical protein
MALLILTLMSALIAGFVGAVVADQRSSGTQRDQTQSYAAAHAGLEKLTSDVASLFQTDFSPSAAQITAVSTRVPTMPGFNFVSPDGTSGYTVTFKPDARGNPEPGSPNGSPITAGPFQGFKGIITPYDLTVTTRTAAGAEVRLRRRLQTVAVPVFQFGVFSDNDLTFYGGDSFDFGGLVHANKDLFLAEAFGQTLTFRDRITAKEIIRKELSNGYTTSGIWQGTVRVTQGSGAFGSLATNQGSVVAGPGSAPNEPPAGNWTSLSMGTFKGNILSQATGAKELKLPLVSAGAQPIDLIRRPAINSNENVANALVFGQRYFSQASVRILLSDTVQDILNLPTVTPTPPIQLGNLGVNPIAGYPHSTNLAPTLAAPFALSGGAAATGTLPPNTYLSNADQPLLNGFLKVEIQRADATWVDVTLEILNLGITGRNLSNGVNLNVAGNVCNVDPYPNSIIRLQRVRDLPILPAYQPCGLTGGQRTIATAASISGDPRDYWPNALYDTREGNVRDATAQLGTSTIYLGGIMHYVELDVRNLGRWLSGAIPGSGTQALNNNGYILYFSDRRNNWHDPAAGNQETGEYGFEDVINPSIASGLPANRALNAGEDVNDNKRLDEYGRLPQNLPVGFQLPMDAAATPLTTLTGTTTSVASRARVNRPIFFRRALKLVNGGINDVTGVNSLPAAGFTVTSENPVYVQGNYNATSTNANAPGDIPAAIIADAVTILSNNWNDLRSFTSPNNNIPAPPSPAPVPPTGEDVGRQATTTAYRFAVAAGKTLSFAKPSWEGSPYLYGTDGGVGNFLRYLEDWNVSNSVWIRYRGSIVSLFTSRQAIGAFKCCNTVYQWGQREYLFDTDFLIPSQLPPGTPMFRDVNTLTFRQLLRPTQ